MSSGTLEYDVDTSSLESLMGELNARQLRSAWKSGLRPSARVIERGVREQLSVSHPAAVKYGDEIETQIWSKGGGYTVAISGKTVEFTNKKGRQVKGSHLYILRWLSRGTNPRFTQKGASRGFVKPSHFFRKGVDATIQPAMDRVADDIVKAIRRAVKRVRKKSGQPL